MHLLNNRLLFHFPIRIRDKLYTEFKGSIPEIYRFKDKYPQKYDKEKNQIDIKLQDIKNLDYVKPIIDTAYKKSLHNE